jgi:DNA-binding SARP family transcriptional activator/TolB-like protein
MVLRLKLLGTFEARNGGSEQLTFPTSKAKALFAYLALERDQPHTREKLSNLFWGEIREDRARANLRQALTRVRQALPASLSNCVMAHNGTVRLDAGVIHTDASEFERCTDNQTIVNLERAAALYRGNLLEGFHVHEESFEGWLRHQRQRYRERAIACFEALLGHYQGFGASTRGIEICNRLLALDPYREPIHRLLMNFYADQERRGAALAQFEECRGLLRDELGVEPEEETTALYQAIRDSSVKTRYMRNPVLSRPRADAGFGRDRSSRAVTNLVSRSPWRGASWAKPSVAVLQFDCLAGDEANRYLCDGIAEDIITNLARFQDIHVIARNSSFAYGDRKPDINQIGEELGVRYIVEGSLQREGDSVRVTAQLIEASTGFHVWAERYDENIAGIAGLRDELTGRIAGVLVGRIEQNQLKRAKAGEPEQWEVYECWLRGMDLLRKVDRANVVASREYFERALTIDPGYARAHAGLAMSWYKAWSCLSWTSWWKLEDKALGYAMKALELDDEDHHIHCILGIISLFTRDFGRARYHLDKAERINPNDARGLANAAIAWSLMGEPERAVRMAELAIRLDPFHPDWYLASLGLTYYVAKDYERAIAAMEAAPDGLCDTRAYLAAAYAQSGDPAAAQPHAVEFIRAACESLGGDPETDVPQYVDAMIKSNPYVRPDDAAHFVEGLRLAGLPVTTGQ